LIVFVDDFCIPFPRDNFTKRAGIHDDLISPQ
jgi:hypothetical protein